MVRFIGIWGRAINYGAEEGDREIAETQTSVQGKFVSSYLAEVSFDAMLKVSLCWHFVVADMLVLTAMLTDAALVGRRLFIFGNSTSRLLS